MIIHVRVRWLHPNVVIKSRVDIVTNDVYASSFFSSFHTFYPFSVELEWFFGVSLCCLLDELGLLCQGRTDSDGTANQPVS